LAASVARRYGLPLRPLPGGIANFAWALGDQLILRVPRSPEFAADLAKEAVVIPVARAAGVLTSSIVEYFGSHIIMTRVPGVDLASLDSAAEGFYSSVGKQLAALHSVTTVDGLTPPSPPGDPVALVDRLAGAGWLDPAAAHWLTGWFGRLAARRSESGPAVLIHGDIAAQNLMADPVSGALTGLIDWGDAALDDPATDFAKLPLPAVLPLLSGYLPAGADVEPWAARILWHHLHWSLARLPDPTPAPAARHWTAPPASRLLGLLRFFASAPPDPWPALT
jgi:aminoglycoside phosphotransferase (APT) family kinase protein